MHIGRRLGQWKASLNSRELAIVPYHMVSNCKTQARAQTKYCAVRCGTAAVVDLTYNDSCTFRCMRVVVDGSLCRLVGRLATPPIGVRDEKQLLLAEHRQSGQNSIRRCLVSLLPCMVRGPDTSCIGNVLAQCQTAIDVERFRIGPGDCEFGVLIDEALGTFLKCCYCFLIPPIGEVASFVVMSTS